MSVKKVQAAPDVERLVSAELFPHLNELPESFDGCPEFNWQFSSIAINELGSQVTLDLVESLTDLPSFFFLQARSLPGSFHALSQRVVPRKVALACESLLRGGSNHRTKRDVAPHGLIPCAYTACRPESNCLVHVIFSSKTHSLIKKS